MKCLTLATLALLSFYAVVSFLPSPAARQRAEKYFAPDVIDTGAQFTLERKLFSWPATFLHYGVLLLLTAHARRLADGCSRLVRNRWLATVLLMGFVCYLAEEAIDLPLGLARLEHARAWGLARQSVAGWLIDHFKGFVLFGVIEGVGLVGFYLLVRLLPRGWWFTCALVAPLLAIAGAYLYPVLIAPMFNTFQPLEQTEYKKLEPVLKGLLDRAGIQYGDLMVMDASRQSGHTNAYFTGWGSTRRIVLFDTLLQKHSQDEIESILAHEIGHWQHDHIAKGIALGALASLLGLYLLYRLLMLVKHRPPWNLRDAADPAGLPLILLCVGLAELATLPVQNVITRHFERQADAVSLELVPKPRAFESTELKMAKDNLSDVAPNPLAVFLFNTHPTFVERIETAERVK